jgi:hypothetical protein
MTYLNIQQPLIVIQRYNNDEYRRKINEFAIIEFCN